MGGSLYLSRRSPEDVACKGQRGRRILDYRRNSRYLEERTKRPDMITKCSNEDVGQTKKSRARKKE